MNLFAFLWFKDCFNCSRILVIEIIKHGCARSSASPSLVCSYAYVRLSKRLWWPLKRLKLLIELTVWRKVPCYFTHRATWAQEWAKYCTPTVNWIQSPLIRIKSAVLLQGSIFEIIKFDLNFVIWILRKYLMIFNSHTRQIFVVFVFKIYIAVKKTFRPLIVASTVTYSC